MLTKPRRIPLSLTIQFTLFFTLIAGLIFYYFTREFEEDALDGFRNKSRMIEKYITGNSEFISENNSELKKRIAELLSLTGADYLVLKNERDSILTAVNLEFAEMYAYTEASSGKHLSLDETILRAFLPVVLADNQRGKIYIGFKTGLIVSEIREKTLFVAFLSLTVLIVGMIFTYLTSLFSFRSVNKLTSALSRENNEEKKSLLPKYENNEVGIIANQVYEILNELDISSQKIESLNERLNGVCREKIYEVGFEINQRKRTESHLKKSEELFKLLFETAPIGMIILSDDGTAIKANKAFCKTIGYEWHETIGANIKYIFNGNRSGDLKSTFQLIRDNESLDTECNLIRKDGRRIAAILKAIKITNDNGERKHILVQVLDITEFKKAQSEIVAALDRATESERLKSAFLAQMSHEIRTPLNVILPSIPIIADELSDKDEEIQNILSAVENASRRLQNTIDMILSLSAVQSGSYKPKFEKFNLAEDIKNLAKEFIPITKEKGLHLYFTNSSSNSEISADRYTVNQIFQNLIGNAVKYTHTGQISVTVEDYQKNRVIVKVEDTGIGISSKYIKNLFSPFSQEDSGRTRKYEGNGLGLALVKEYVKINRGEISVQSEKNVGSTFSVHFEKSIHILALSEEKIMLHEIKTLLN